MKCLHRQPEIIWITLNPCTPKAKMHGCELHGKCSLDERVTSCEIINCHTCSDRDNGEVETCDES